MNRDGFLGVVTPIGGPDPLISFQLVSVTTVGVRERNRSGILVGRPGLDPGTLRVFPDRPGTSISVQIC
jgi:hypothetical protein